MKKLFLFTLGWLAIGSLTLSCTSKEQAPTHKQSPEQGKFKIIGYLESKSMDIADIQFKYLTHINYSFAIPRKEADGKLEPVPAPEYLKQLVAEAHKNGVKVFISVGGWGIGDGGGNDTRFEVLANEPTSRTAFAGSVMEVVRKFNLDGADIDWEYPDPIEPSSSNYVKLMSELRDSLHAHNKKLTAAVVSYHDRYGYGVRKEIFDIVDWLNIMAYDDDYNTFNGQHVPHSPYWLAVRAFDYWIERGLPKEKAVMGVPFYGKGNKKGASYKSLLAQGANPYYDEYDSIYYNGIKTMKEKTALAMKRGAGIMYWSMSGDTHDEYSLLKAIYDKAHQEK